MLARYEEQSAIMFEQKILLSTMLLANLPDLEILWTLPIVPIQLIHLVPVNSWVSNPFNHVIEVVTSETKLFLLLAILSFWIWKYFFT